MQDNLYLYESKWLGSYLADMNLHYRNLYCDWGGKSVQHNLHNNAKKYILETTVII